MSVLYEMFTVLQGFQAPPLLPAGPFYVWASPVFGLHLPLCCDAATFPDCALQDFAEHSDESRR